MKITPIKTNPTAFSALYKTQDVLSLITGYEYKGKSTIPATIKSLTGVDLYSDEFHKKIDENPQYLYAVMSIQDACTEEVLKQHPEFKSADDSFDCKLHLKKGRKAQDDWFKVQMRTLPDKTDIKPFCLDISVLREKYNSFKEIFEKIF
ncbi:MAG: hypothetical protein ACI37R_08635 [Candidatus Avigastranaerophilus sp.]